MKYLNSLLLAAGMSAIMAQLEKLGLSVRASIPAQLGALVKSDMVRWQKVVTTAGITAN